MTDKLPAEIRKVLVSCLDTDKPVEISPVMSRSILETLSLSANALYRAEVAGEKREEARQEAAKLLIKLKETEAVAVNNERNWKTVYTAFRDLMDATNALGSGSPPAELDKYWETVARIKKEWRL